MHQNHRLYLKPGLLQLFNVGATLPLFIYSSIIFLVSLGDAMMTYFSPVYIESRVSNTLVMGAIISFSSVIGLVVDSILSEKFKGKKYQFFMSGAIIGGLVFPLTYIVFGAWIPALFLSMAVWGVYFECLLFSNFFAIKALVSHENHAFGWGILKTFQAAAYVIGPLVASALIEINTVYTLYAAASVQALALICFLIFHNSRKQRPPAEESTMKRGLKHQLMVWRLLLPKIWPLMLFELTLTLVDATFWNIGSVLAESWQGQHPHGGLLLTAYMIPSLFMGVFAGLAAKPLGKKRAAFISGLCSGTILAIAGLTTNISLFVGMVFVSSLLSALTVPEILGTIEDYIDRLGKSSSELVGLENSTTSLAFIIGPIAAGGIAAIIGNQRTFTVVGCLLVLVSLIGLLFVPRKIRLPEQAIENLD